MGPGGAPNSKPAAGLVRRQADLDPARLVFLDETWAKTNMARSHGRCRRGERLRMGAPHGHWQTSTFVAGLTLRGWVAPFVFSGPINREAFETWVEHGLVPELRPGDIVVLDNLSSHKGSAEDQTRTINWEQHPATRPHISVQRAQESSTLRCGAYSQ